MAEAEEGLKNPILPSPPPGVDCVEFEVELHSMVQVSHQIRRSNQIADSSCIAVAPQLPFSNCLMMHTSSKIIFDSQQVQGFACRVR